MSKTDEQIHDNTFTRREFGTMAGALAIASQTPILMAQPASAHPSLNSYRIFLDSILNRYPHRDAWTTKTKACAVWAAGEFHPDFRKPGTATPVEATQVDITHRGTTFNVIAELLADSGPVKTPTYILCAHLDSFDEDVTGANDNASGVAAVLELAQAAAGIPNRTHNLICILTGGEEKQLAGSRTYCEKTFPPVGGPVPADYRVINIDTIAGKKFNPSSKDFYLEYDSGLSGNLKVNMESANSRLPAPLDVEAVQISSPPGTSKRLSDHASFLIRGVPAVSITQHENDNNMHTIRDNRLNVVPANGYQVVAWVHEFLKSSLL